MSAVLDAETGIPADGLSLLTELTVKLGVLADTITRDRDERRAQRRLQRQPNIVTVYGAPIGQTQAVIGTLVTGQVVLDLGGPQMGRRWEVRGLAVSDGGNVATAVSGIANWYVGKAVTPTVPLANWVPVAPTAWRWYFAALPNLADFSSDARTVLPMDRLYCVITGNTSPGQSIMASAEINDFDPVDQLMTVVM